MRKYKNLDLLLKQHGNDVNKMQFADLLINDLKQACCLIFGETKDEQAVLLAELKIQADSLDIHTGLFQHQIEFVVEGEIVNDQYPALTYRVHGNTVEFYGRCSTIPQVCGVDLYLHKSYTAKAGDMAIQKFTIPVSKLFRSLK